MPIYQTIENREQEMKIKRMLRFWGIPIACVLCLLFIFKVVLMIGYVPSSSMEPTISKGSLILGMRFYGELRCGDIIIFEKDGKNMVKRIAAMPGDMIYLDDNTHVVSINKPLDEAPRILKVPADSYFVLGDNRAVSVDSRFWADPFVTDHDIVAVLL